MLIALENRKQLDRAWWISAWRDYRIPVAASLLTAAVVSGFFYTDGFRQPGGAIDAVRTFFVYETVDGHDKPFGWYFNLLALPFKSGGVWWFGTPVVILALLGYVSTFRRQDGRFIIRFIAYAAVGHFAIYSLIAYKTPWLACLPWAHVCLLAGFGVLGIFQSPAMDENRALPASRAWRWSRSSSNPGRSPDASHRTTGTPSPTSRPATTWRTLEPWLKQLQQIAPGGTLEPIGVIGADYWPLPWYLRSFGKIGYWPEPIRRSNPTAAGLRHAGNVRSRRPQPAPSKPTPRCPADCAPECR